MKNLSLIIILSLSLTACSSIKQILLKGDGSQRSFFGMEEPKPKTPQVPKKAFVEDVAEEKKEIQEAVKPLPPKKTTFKIISFAEQLEILLKAEDVSASDIKLYENTMQNVLENYQNGKPLSWSSKDKIFAGDVIVDNSFEIKDSKQYCREYSQKITFKQQQFSAKAVACRTGERFWEAINVQN
jgi:surface antigen